VVRTRYKESTNFDNVNNTIGMSFDNTKTYIARKFSNKNEEDKFMDMLGTLQMPEKDEMPPADRSNCKCHLSNFYFYADIFCLPWLA